MKKAILLAITLAGSASGADLPEAPKPHKFLDKTNLTLFSTLATTYSLDGKFTRDIMGTKRVHPYERNPIARPFVNSDRAMAGYVGAGFAVDVALMALLHKKGHHKVERVVGWVSLGVEGYAIASDLSTKKKFGL